jgi:hypothetical protein
MDRTTLIIVLIVVLIVMNMGRSSSEEHFSNFDCHKEYKNINGRICPEQCPKLHMSFIDNKPTYKCKK